MELPEERLEHVNESLAVFLVALQVLSNKQDELNKGGREEDVSGSRVGIRDKQSCSQTTAL